MPRYAVSILMDDRPVMCDVIEAPNATTAKAAWTSKFWNSPDALRSAMSGMDALNKAAAGELLQLMDTLRAEARVKGIKINARLSRSKRGARVELRQ